MNALISLTTEQENAIRLQIKQLFISELEKLSHPVEKQYLNKKQACQYLNVSNNTLDKWIEQGLPAIRIGTSIRFNKEHVDEWIMSLEK